MQKIKYRVTNQSYNNLAFRLIIVFSMYQFHRTCRKQKVQLQTIVSIILAFIIVHVFTFIEILFLHTSYCLVSFYFILLDTLEPFLQGGLSGNKLSQHLFMWDCLFISHFLTRVLPDIGFLVDNCFLLVFFIYCPIAFWPLRFLMKNMLTILLRSPYMQ